MAELTNSGSDMEHTPDILSSPVSQQYITIRGTTKFPTRMHTATLTFIF